MLGACWLKGLPEGAGDPNAGVLPPAGVCGVPNPPDDPLLFKTTQAVKYTYRSGTVNSKSFVGKALLRIKWKFELN